jgi:hypothetical protein
MGLLPQFREKPVGPIFKSVVPKLRKLLIYTTAEASNHENDLQNRPGRDVILSRNHVPVTCRWLVLHSLAHAPVHFAVAYRKCGCTCKTPRTFHTSRTHNAATAVCVSCEFEQFQIRKMFQQQAALQTKHKQTVKCVQHPFETAAADTLYDSDREARFKFQQCEG